MKLVVPSKLKISKLTSTNMKETAVGYGSELVGGVIEQNKIYNFIAEVLFNDGNL